MDPQVVTTPRPDPTVLTSRAVAAATDQWRRELESAIATVNARLDAMTEADALRLDGLREVRPQTERQIYHLRELHEAKFAAIEQRFDERDVRTAQAERAAQEALRAALQAAKELVDQQNKANAEAADKAERNTTKQIDQIGALIQTNQKATDDRILEIKERIDRGEGSHAGAVEVTTARRLDVGQALLALSVLLAAVAIVVTIVAARGGK